MSKNAESASRNTSHAGPRRDKVEPSVPEPTHAERARTLMHRQSVGFLSSQSRQEPGFPFGSVMPFALDESGRPLFLISKMAMHTQNVDRDPRSSLLVPEEAMAQNPLGSARATLIGETRLVPEDETQAVREIYLARHENARYWVNYTDFGFYRMEIVNLYYVGGFGVMGWVEATDYAVATADPLADHATGIIEHMNEDHVDAMILLAAKVAGLEADEAAMTAIDRLGFHLRLRNGDSYRGCRIAFPRPVETPEASRTVLVEMVRQARGT